MARARWFIFDLGNVLIRLDYDRILERIEKRSTSKREQIIDLLDGPGGYRDLEKGIVSFRDFHQFVCDRIGYEGDLRGFRELWADFFSGAVEGIDEVLRRVRLQYRVAFLSNSNEVHAEVIPRRFAALFEKDDVFIFSHRLRCAKPDPETYIQALELLGAHPSETLFVDDLLENVSAAKNLGIQAFQFESAPALLRLLEERGLLAVD